MSLELKKETLKPKNPADMALRFWKNESKQAQKRMSLKEFYMRREFFKMLNIPDPYFQHLNKKPDVFQEASIMEEFNNDFKMLLNSDYSDFKVKLKDILDKAIQATNRYSDVKDINKLNSGEKVYQQMNALKEIKNKISSEYDVNKKAEFLEDYKTISFALSASYLAKDALKEEIEKSSERVFGDKNYFDKNNLLGADSQALKKRFSRAFDDIMEQDLSLDSDIKVNNTNKSKIKPKYK